MRALRSCVYVNELFLAERRRVRRNFEDSVSDKEQPFTSVLLRCDPRCYFRPTRTRVGDSNKKYIKHFQLAIKIVYAVYAVY